MKRGRSTIPKVLESAVSLVRPSLPEGRPGAVALTTLDKRPDGMPAAAQFLAPVAGASPWLMKLTSHGSWANSNEVEHPRNSSVTAGARIECVVFPRNCMSLIADRRNPPAQVVDLPAIELSPPRTAP